jgi:hypothetical protein
LGGVIKILLRSGEAVRIRMAHASSSGQAIWLAISEQFVLGYLTAGFFWSSEQ